MAPRNTSNRTTGLLYIPIRNSSWMARLYVINEMEGIMTASYDTFMQTQRWRLKLADIVLPISVIHSSRSFDKDALRVLISCYWSALALVCASLLH